PPSIAAPSTQSVSSRATALTQALAANPITAPYRLAVFDQGRQVVLAGRVGDSRVHAVAVRTAIAMGIPISDQIVIDTAAYALAGQASGPWGPAQPSSIISSYTYPPPLFGRYDDPFFGLEPPLVSYAPWWGAAGGYRLAQDQAINQAPPANANANADPAAGQPLPPNTIEASIDPYGVATLRGVVPTDAARVEIGQRMARMPGISQVDNRLTIGPLANVAAPPRRVIDDNPPPPPTPSMVKPRPDTNEPAGRPIGLTNEPARPQPAPADRAVARADGAAGRADRAIQDRPELAGQPVKVAVRDGVASLSGSVPSVYEAMLAFRAVQQTPGVQAVADTLRFVVPDGTVANPLLTKAKPTDVEPYVEAQVRRQLGDSAHVDRVRLEGDQLVIQGTVERADDRERVEAILRSMPILRGFKILPEFRPLYP
ncbi:MAG TPA: BON domain-containing protein, partial [Isosphaeraceae bacterium]